MDGESDDTFGFLRMEAERMWRLGHEIGALAVLITIGVTLSTGDSQQDLGDAIVTLSIALPLVLRGSVECRSSDRLGMGQDVLKARGRVRKVKKITDPEKTATSHVYF